MCRGKSAQGGGRSWGQGHGRKRHVRHGSEGTGVGEDGVHLVQISHHTVPILINAFQ